MPRELKVIVERQWRDPNIRIEVEIDITAQGLSLRVPLVAFLAEIVAQVGNPTLLITTDQLRRKVMAAADDAISKMKAETARVM